MFRIRLVANMLAAIFFSYEQHLISGGVQEYHKKAAELIRSRDVTGIVGIDADCYIIGSWHA